MLHQIPRRPLDTSRRKQLHVQRQIFLDRSPQAGSHLANRLVIDNLSLQCLK
jgi:hypothetical protein